MQKSKKIEVYMKKHPRAGERELMKKFHLTREEARQVVCSHNGEGSTLPTSENSWWQRAVSWCENEKRLLLTLFSLGVFVRLLYAFFVLRDQLFTVPLHDAKYYLLWAQDIANQGWLGDSVFFTEPFYAYFLALFLTFFGENGTTGLLLLQWFCGALVPVGLYLVTKAVFSRQAALVTGILSALYGPFIFYEGLLLKTSLEVALLPWFLLLLFWALRKKEWLAFFLLGLFLGILSLIKGNNLIFIPTLIGLFFFFLREENLLKRTLLSGVFVLGVALLILPVTLRNFVVGHDLVVTNYSFGLVVYQGSWWGGDGSTALVPPFLRPNPAYEETDAVGMAEAYAKRDLMPSEVSSFWVDKALEEIFASPGRFLGVLWNKVLILLNHSEFSDNYQFIWFRSHIPLLWFLPNFFLVGFFGLVGLALLFSGHFWKIIHDLSSVPRHAFLKNDHALVIVALFLASIAVLLLTTVNARYRIPLIPFFLIFSGGAIVYLWTCLRESDGFRFLVVGMVGFLAFLLLLYPLSLSRFDTTAQSYHALGYEELLSGRYQSAEELFEKTLAVDPEYAWAYGNLMLTALAQGRYEAAEAALKKLLILRSDDFSNYRHLRLLKDLQGIDKAQWPSRVRAVVEEVAPKNYDANFNEAERYRAAGDVARAESLYRLSLDEYPDAQGARIALAGLYRSQNQSEEAKHLLEQAVAADPLLFPARYNLANIFIQENNFGPVVDLLKEIYDFVPELGETWYNYAVALIKSNRSAEAVPVMQAYIERYQDDASRKSVVEKFQAALKPTTGNDLETLIKQQSGQ